jgi:cytochrome c
MRCTWMPAGHAIGVAAAALMASAAWSHGLSGQAHTHGPALKGDAVRGKAVYEAKCSACHSVSEDRVGPKHRGVFGRKAGAVSGYDYSDALTSSRVVWNAATLQRWLTDPEAVIPGQRMGYRLGKAQERDDVIAYLASLK